MSSKTFKKGMLASSIAMVLAGVSSQAMAADEANAVKKDEVEVIEVKGIRGSLKQNINNKRFSDAIVDSISAEDIGKFPDKNVAESLSRITGVGISREFGEGEKITIRGSDPTKNRTLLNGQNVGTADWFILDNPSRSFNFTMLPSSLVSNLEVYKSPEARLDEGSIGGTVILKTRKPLDLDANTVNLSLQSQYSDVPEEHDPLIEGLYSWKNESEKFGALISLSDSKRSVQREGIEVLGWDRLDNGEYAPRTTGIPVFTQDRERRTIFASLQFAPSEEFDVTLNVLDSKMDVNNSNSNFLIMNPGTTASNTLTKEGENIVAVQNSGDGRVNWNHINRISKTDTSSVHLDMNFHGESFSVNAQLGTTSAEGGTVNETSWEYGVNTSYDLDLRGTPTFNTGVDATDPSQFSGGWIWGGNKPSTDDEDYVQVDIDVPVEWGAFSAVKFGVKHRDHKRTQDRQAYSWHWGLANDGTSPHYMGQILQGDCPTLAQCDLTTGSHTVGGGVVNGNGNAQLIHNSPKMLELGLGPNASYAVHRNLAEVFEVEEAKTSYYVQGDFSGDDFRGNVGVRVATTKQSSSGFLYSGNLLTISNPGLNEDLTPANTWLTEERTYTEILPSFNLAYDLQEDQVVRLSAARVMARPNFFEISPIAAPGDLGETNPTAQAGNPNLDPQIANQFDIAWEYYYSSGSVFAATLFYKDIESYQTSGTSTALFYYDQEDRMVEATVTRPENGPGGTTTGLELTFQHDFGNGFGVTANYTYTDANNDGVRDVTKPGSGLVEGASEHMSNFSGYYETEDFSARVMYNYRTEWYKGLHETGSEVWNDDFAQLDFSTSYNITENISLIFEAVNLTDEKITEFNTDSARMMSIYQNGRRYVIGANFNF